MGVLPVYVRLLPVGSVTRPEAGVRSPKKVVAVNCELCECWKMNPGSLGEQSVLITTEPVSNPRKIFNTDTKQASGS